MKSSYSLADAKKLFNHWPHPWAVAGGWAIDIFAGRQTRNHEDLDITILRENHRALRNLFSDWDIRIGLGESRLAGAWSGDQPLSSDRHVLWCRENKESQWAFELLLNESSDKQWIFRRDDRIRLPLTKVFRNDKNDIPYMAPQVVLLYKAKAARELDEQDFDFVNPLLEPSERQWLKEAIEVVHPDHR